MINRIRIALSAIKKRVTGDFSLRQNSYLCEYVSSVSNTQSKVSKRLKLIMPLPLEFEFQQISDLEILPECKIATERHFKNRFAVWSFVLEPSENKEFSIKFKAKVTPYSLKSEELLQLKKLKDKDEAIALKPNRYINGEDIKVIALAKQILKFKNLRDLKLSRYEVALKINSWLLKNLKYGNPILGLYTYLEALKNPQTDCGGYGTLFCSLCNAVGIPAKMVSGFWSGYENNTMHAWAGAQLESGAYAYFDTSVEQLSKKLMSTKIARPNFLGSDRVAFSFGCDLELEESVRTDILQTPILVGGNKNIKIEYTFLTEKIKNT